MTTKITAPDERFTGSTYIGPTILEFTAGVATTDVQLKPGTVRYLEKHGYTVDQGGAAQVDGDIVDLTTLTVDQLRGYATEHGIDLGGATRKADIVNAIASAPLDPVEGDDLGTQVGEDE